MSRPTESNIPDEQTFRLLFDGHSAIMLLIEPQSGIILDANRAAVDFYGYPKNRLCGMSIHKINTLPPEQVEAERLRALREERNYFLFPHRLANGEERSVEVHSSPITLGERRVLFSVIHDITARQQAEMALQKSEAHYRAVTQTAHEAIVIGDSAGNVIESNHSVQAIFGYTEAELHGKPLAILMPARFRHARAGVREHAGKIIELVGQRKDGSEFPLEYSLSEWQDGENRFYTAILRDISDRKRAEEALRESEARLRLMFENSLTGILMTHPNGAIFAANAEACRLLGWTEAELCQLGRAGVVNTADPRLTAALEERVRTGKFRGELTFIRADGTDFPVELVSSLFADLTGQVHANIFFHDISARKQVEAALQQSEAHYHLLTDHMTDKVWLTDLDLRLTYVSPSVEKMRGYTLDELRMLPLEQNLTPASLQKVMEVIAEEIPKVQADPTYGVERTLELEFFQKDGSTYLEENKISLIRDENGAPVSILGEGRDITERKRAQALLEQTRKNYETFFNSIDDFLFVLNEQGNIIHMNQTVIDRLGYEAAELLGQSVLIVHPPERRAEAGRIVGEMLAGTADFCPVPVMTKSGEQIPVETRITPGFWDDKPVIFGVTKDISQIKLSEEKFSKAFQSNSALMALSNFASGRFIDVNDVFLATLGFTRAEVIGKTSGELIIFPDNSHRQKVITLLERGQPVRDVEVTARAKDGALHAGLFSATSIYVGQELCLLTTMVDITARKRAEQELQTQRDFATQVINAMGQGLTVTDMDGHFEFVNPAYAHIFGYEPETLIGKSPQDVTAKEDRAAILEQKALRQAGKTTTYESRLHRADGSIAPVLITGVPRLRDGQYAGAIAVITDLTEQKRIKNELRHAKDALEQANQQLEQALLREQKLARTDALTGVYNRGYLFELAAHEFEVAARYQTPLAVIMFDIDNFKQINDLFGHPIGDQALIRVAQAIVGILRATDVIGRYGGDEFTILLPQTSAQDALSLAGRIQAKLAAINLEAGKGLFKLTISLGIAQTIPGVTLPPDTVEDLLLRADKALYAAKQAGKNRSVIFNAQGSEK